MLVGIVPYRDNKAGLERLLDSLPEDFPVVIMDDCSEHPLILKRKNRRVRAMPKRGFFAGTVNAAIEAAKKEFGKSDYLILNQDVWFDDLKFIEEMRKPHPEACIGDGVMHHPAWPKGYVQGTCMWVNGEVWDKIGGFDEKFWPLWGGTADWQLRATRAGYKARPMEVRGLQHERQGEFGSSIQKLLEEEPEKRGLYVRTPPLISVVVPCYNYGKFLPDLLASLIGGESSIGVLQSQTFQGFEVIIVDDQSIDDSWEQAKLLADPWKGIRVVRREQNGGTAATLNTAIRHAYGRYIVSVDADDMLAPTALETFLNKLENDPSKLYYTDQRYLTSNGLSDIIRTREYDFTRLLVRNMVPAGAAYSKRAWQEAGGYPEQFARGRQDWAFAVAMGAKNHCGERIPEPLYYYRRQGQNRSLFNTDPFQHAEFLKMMRTTFPTIYGGNMAGCCGSRGAAIVAKTLSQVPIQPGAEGMTLVEYIGDNVARHSLRGAVTHLAYTFKGSMRKFYVDNRDLPKILDYLEGRKYVIQLAEPFTPADPTTIKELVEYA